MAIRSTSRGRIPEMDGLRALAIGAVMVEHFAGGPIRHISHLMKLAVRREFYSAPISANPAIVTFIGRLCLPTLKILTGI